MQQIGLKIIQMYKYPIVLKIMDDKETKEYHLKRLERLCLQSIKEDRFYKGVKGGSLIYEDMMLTRREKSWL